MIENKINNSKNKKVVGLFTVICICFLIIGYENLNKKQIVEILLGRKLINDNQNIENIDIFNEMCENCVVDISDNIINTEENPLYFRMFVVNKNLTENGSKDEKLIQKGNHQLLEVNCKIVGVSQNFIKIE